MSRMLITLLISMMPLFSIRYDIGITGSTGYGFSRWNVEVYDTSGTFITDQLQSNEPVFNVGILTNVLFTQTFGIRAGMQYGWYAYKYAYNNGIDPYDTELTWTYRNLLVPIELVFGIPAGENRIILGYGIVICKQLQGNVDFTSGYVEDISSDDLETTIAPQFFLGIELLRGHFILSPTISYSYNLNGVGGDFGYNISTHYVVLTAAVSYRIQ